LCFAIAGSYGECANGRPRIYQVSNQGSLILKPQRMRRRLPLESEYIQLCIIGNVSSMKAIVWLGDSIARLRAASAGIRSDAGYQLDLVQRGEMPTDFRPMPDVDPPMLRRCSPPPTTYNLASQPA